VQSLELKIPPLVVVLVAGTIMWVLAVLTPTLSLRLPHVRLLGGALMTAGILAVIAGVVAFRRAQTTVDPTRPDHASAVVTQGIYALTRNPMYLGFLLALVGWAAWLGNLPACLVPALFVQYMNRFQIEPEERLLADKFGAPYRDYLLRVRRWI
jgi:protein-S-isoprenylcysteine O-methyltransferase Ste14